MQHCHAGHAAHQRQPELPLAQTIAFGMGSGLGYVYHFIVREGRHRISSKDVPAIFRACPATIYIGILSLAIYGLVGHSVGIVTYEEASCRMSVPCFVPADILLPWPRFRWTRGPASPLTSLPPSLNTGNAPKPWLPVNPVRCMSCCPKPTWVLPRRPSGCEDPPHDAGVPQNGADPQRSWLCVC